MMKRLQILIAAIIATLTVSAQTVHRQEGETAEAFARRLQPDSAELVFTVIETTEPGAYANMIIAFYRKTVYEAKQMKTYIDHNQYDILIGYLYLPAGKRNYERKILDTLLPDGGDPDILSVFFANADKDTTKELIILCKYEQKHYDYEGDLYETFIYDFRNGEINFLKPLSEKFFGCECEWRNGKKERAKYKTAADVKSGLVKSGFR